MRCKRVDVVSIRMQSTMEYVCTVFPCKCEQIRHPWVFKRRDRIIGIEVFWRNGDCKRIPPYKRWNVTGRTKRNTVDRGCVISRDTGALGVILLNVGVYSER